MGIRRVWVRRPGASATLVPIKEEDLVDDVRDMILKKYANSLGRSFDAPDVTLRIGPRHLTPRASPSGDRVLGPEEPLCRLLDAYYPGGQTVEEALIIDVPRRTPRPSPRGGLAQVQQIYDEYRPAVLGGVGGAGEYFPPMPVVHSPHLHHHHHHPETRSTTSGSMVGNGGGHSQIPHQITVLTTTTTAGPGGGSIPALLPSPGGGGGGTSRAKHHNHNHNHTRPRVGRQHTASPTLLTNPGLVGDASTIPPPPALPHSPIIDGIHTTGGIPSTRISAPNLPSSNNKFLRKGGFGRGKNGDSPSANGSRSGSHQHLGLSAGVLEGAVPPINVLLVEDNIINLKLLEAFMKRLKVRWQTAMNGREAVTKWRAGGFHLKIGKN
ncbi:MAG: Transmembrane osmosensor [Watsoniomyces obsoletus]|nr:MAG: Transmembrane osmosensor [Watsoniomyces obsoletus]